MDTFGMGTRNGYGGYGNRSKTDELHDTVTRLKIQNDRFYQTTLQRQVKDDDEEALRKDNLGLKELWDQYQTMLQLVRNR